MRYPFTILRCCLVPLVAFALSSCTSLKTPDAAEAAAPTSVDQAPANASQPPASASIGQPETPSEPVEQLPAPVFTPEQQAELEQLPPPRTDLWEVIVEGYGIPDLQGPLVDKWEQWYSSRPDYVARMINRSRMYLYHIVHEIHARRLPMEIALLPMIESAYNPNALSTSRASGIWQFIPSTGKNYGLKQNWWFDERRDVLSATDSALDYLQKLYGDFSDWQLALAAYNWGEGSVARAQAKNRAKGLPETFEALKMPNEPANYVPKLQAVKNIIRDPEKYGIELTDIPDAPYFTVVKTTKRMDVDRAAALAEVSKEEFLALNPQHNRPVIAGADEFTLLLPIDKAELFAAKLELADQPLVTWQAYRLRKGETFAQVANKFSMSLEALRAVNGLGRRAQAREGVTLLVPTQQSSHLAEASLAQAVFTMVPAEGSSHYKVKRGDTLAKIAGRYGMTTDELLRLNGFKSAKNLHVGKSIRVPGGNTGRTASPAAVASGMRAHSAATTPAMVHQVQKGDTLAKIAARYRVSVQDLMRWNGLTSAKSLRQGQVLRLSGETAFTQTAPSHPITRAPAAASVTYYKVQKGDTLGRIAARYNISIANLMRWNGLKETTTLRIGQALRISEAIAQNVAKPGKK